MSQIVYKVVLAKWEGSEIVLRSSLSYGHPAGRVYEPGIVTFPVLADSYLYAFDDEQAACHYITGAGEILRPTVQPQVWSAEADVVAVDWPTCTWVDIEKYWQENHYAEGPLIYGLCPCPPHTVWCTWIKLLELIQGEQPIHPETRGKR